MLDIKSTAVFYEPKVAAYSINAKAIQYVTVQIAGGCRCDLSFVCDHVNKRQVEGSF